ncbi:bifunctional DNA-formamidopyrimidine glycosylase/DNA-(apurinic or apyrimidinic site) lyase [Sphingomonas sp.]|uniref:bifunctional DNA-formamidopyrimidine glycosylase/DNA-(apurinic or apyrimidinic site) lyase n=1 Tax=Sphingomonas sp. TaxID=28214 RepID=UPI001D3F0406|nr:bifunctional DNA-formamidopyrimidine glycosylase/DNA-(apurinic or apyrimidinic site) lyase [Sphingomonas sp.]MBX9797377.1 bifunctional DNA-formamidopyrimidine glycosylase/DNA-(apurinic or apyrimidinic site) lyase [Sphingomonas sp.]
MPELPEVETTVRGLGPALMLARITVLETARDGLRRPFPPDLAQRMIGARVTGLGRRAKYGLIATDRGDTMIFHLGMSGRWRVDPAAPWPHDHLRLETEAGRVLVLNDPRRFGSVDLVPTDALAAYPAFAAMGPEPLGPDFSADHLARAFEGRVAPVKALLLDQRVVAGLGNIYVCEALHRAGIAPARAAGRIATARLAPLAEAIRAVLTEAIEAGGSTLRDYARPDGELGYFAKDWRVYGREGAPCPACGSAVKRRTESGRSSFWCARCQR